MPELINGLGVARFHALCIPRGGGDSLRFNVTPVSSGRRMAGFPIVRAGHRECGH